MLRTAHGDRRQAVELGPVQGENTLIRQGLSPGAEVVVENPYLDFHRDFAQHYQQPD
jgi:cobalt-zinc-cadmium efflux system membrane fusion protein